MRAYNEKKNQRRLLLVRMFDKQAREKENDVDEEIQLSLNGCILSS